MMSHLNQPALLLSKLWQPVRQTTVREALVLAFTGAARLVDPRTYESYAFDEWLGLPVEADAPAIRSVRQRIKVPEVAVLTRHAPMRLTGLRFNRRNLFKRDRHTCQYCGAQPGADGLSVDHVVSPSRGGFSGWTNCVVACEQCIGVKGDGLPEQAGLRLKRSPFEPRFSPLIDMAFHFCRQTTTGVLVDGYATTQLDLGTHFPQCHLHVGR